MFRLIILIECIFCWISSINAQSLFMDTILSRIHEQACVYPQEKLHLHTDRSVYIIGDTIWMKAYVVDAMTHNPIYKSRYAYVELINPFNQLEHRIKLRQDSLGMIHGNLILQDTLPAGNYWLRAYTRFMQNEGIDYLFQKPIKILNPIEKTVKMQLLWDKNQKLCIDFVNRITGEPFSVNNVEVSSENGTLYFNKEDNQIKIPHWDKEKKILMVKAGNYKQYLSCEREVDYDVSFMPEGGQLIMGALCKVAFKAINTKGLGENIEGIIVNEKGDTVTAFRSFHKGMGTFSLTPSEEIYYAHCTSSIGLKKVFQLPKIEADKYALTVKRNKSCFFVSYLGALEQRDSLILLVHQRGMPKFIETWPFGLKEWIFELDAFTEGIVHFLLLDMQGNILSERMAFVSKKRERRCISLDSLRYLPNSKVSLSLQANGIDGKPLNGHASIAVTDDADLLPDSLNSVLSSLLLASDLKGYIEEPHWYFNKTDRKRLEALDMLMLTQGWRRYDLQKVIKEKDYALPYYKQEECMNLKGKIISAVLRKPIEGALVRIMAPTEGMMEEITTDKEGRYELKGFEFPDSTTYIVMANSKKGKSNVVVEVDKEEYPLIKKIHPNELYKHDEVGWPQYLEKVNECLAYEKGMRHIFLDEVVVAASYKRYNTDYQMNADKVITEEMIKRSGADSFDMLIRSLAGFRVLNGNTLYVLDDTPLDRSVARQVMSMIRPEDIQQIDIIKGMKCIGYFTGKQDAIVAVTLKSGGVGASWNPVNVAYILPLGYQKKMDFYVPKYNVANDMVDDWNLRTTIYWQPDVIFKDGKAEVVFYTAGMSANYSIVVEGVMQGGHILREVEEMVVQENSIRQ